MGKKSSVQQKEDINAKASLEKRYEHLKAKQRDRGGIFKPREDNPFLELLMARDISGRSPTKRRSMSRQSSIDRQPRGAGLKKNDQTQSSIADRRKSVVGSVAGKQRRKSVAPDLAAEQPDDDEATKRKSRPSSASRTASKQSGGTTKSPAPKRPHEDEEHVDDDEDAPSPPKRPKKSAARASSASTSTSKTKKATRKAPTKAAAKVRSKPQDVYPPSSVDVDKAERPKPHPKVQNKKGKSKKVSDETDILPLHKSMGRPAQNSNDKPSSSKKQKTPMSTKNREDVDDDNDTRPPAGNKKNRIAKGGPQLKPGAPADYEESESTQYRTKLSKPHLETVFEEEDDALNASVTRVSNTSTTSKSRKNKEAQPAKPRKSKKGKQEDKLAIADDSDAKLPAKHSTRNGKSKSRTKAPASKFKPVETHVEERKPVPEARRKPNDSASASRSKSSARKTKTKPKATSRKASSISTKPTFKNLATTMLMSPIRPANNEADELDFL